MNMQMSQAVVRAPSISARPCLRRRAPAARIAISTKASGDNFKFRLNRTKDLTPAIAAALFAGVTQGAFNVAANEVRLACAIATLSLPFANTVAKKEHYDTVSSSLAPASLAAAALELVSIVPATLITFGSKLCKHLSDEMSISGIFYLALASLGACVYYGYGAVWFCGAYGLLHGTQVVNGLKGNTVYLVPSLVTAAAGYALYDFARTKSLFLVTQAACCIVVAQIIWSVFNSGLMFVNGVADK